MPWQSSVWLKLLGRRLLSPVSEGMWILKGPVLSLPWSYSTCWVVYCMWVVVAVVTTVVSNRVISALGSTRGFSINLTLYCLLLDWWSLPLFFDSFVILILEGWILVWWCIRPFGVGGASLRRVWYLLPQSHIVLHFSCQGLVGVELESPRST